MIHHVLLLTLALAVGDLSETNEVIVLPSIEFSEPASTFESGQPVFPKGTKAVLRNLTCKESRVVINDKVDQVLSADKIEVSDLVNLSEGTYTVIVEMPNGTKEIFGFTIK